MKKGLCSLLAMVLMSVCFLCSCKANDKIDAVDIVLSDTEITVDGATVSKDKESAVYVANDIVYYETEKDFTYGEGREADAHTVEEAASHTVVHISKAGNYRLSGKLSSGQIAVDLGEEAESDETKAVTLILNGVDIKCTVAPAVIFYNVYECGSKEEETATQKVDTSLAGANVIIADKTENNIEGSYVAKIYKSVTLSEDGTEVTDSKKLHKYDGAFYSKMSMNVSGEKKGNGILNIKAENEGLDSELHLTINGGNINIESGNDGINTNEDNISVTTINGGNINITANGATGEGDGIDSNGWLVINGGSVTAYGCGISGDAGIDSDKGIYINGGEVLATGNMFDSVASQKQNYAVFTFAKKQKGGEKYTLKDENGKVAAEYTPQNDFTILVISSEKLKAADYTFYCGDKQMVCSAGMMGGMQRPQMPQEGMPEGEIQPGEGTELPNGENFARPEVMPELPNGEMPTRPENDKEFSPNGQMQSAGSEIFTINAGGNFFGNIKIK